MNTAKTKQQTIETKETLKQQLYLNTYIYVHINADGAASNHSV